MPGSPGPEGKEGARGVAGQVEKSLLDTNQADEIVTGVNGVVLNNALQLIGGLITFPNLPTTLGTFNCQ